MFILSGNSTFADPRSCMCGKVKRSWLRNQQYASQMTENGLDGQTRRVVYSLLSSFCVMCCFDQTNGSYFLTKNFRSRAPLCCHVSQLWLVTPLVLCCGGRHSSVGIATRYGLDGPGLESRWGRDFPHPSRPALGPIQPPVQWVPCLSRG